MPEENKQKKNTNMEQNKCIAEAIEKPTNHTPTLYSGGSLSWEKGEALRRELSILYNRLGIDTALNMHDFLLAEGTVNFLILMGNTKYAEEELLK